MDTVVLTVIGTGIALFVANWKVQAGWFSMIDKRFEAIDKRFEAIDKRFENVDKRFEAAERRWMERIEKSEERARADNLALHQRFDAVNERLDGLYRYLLQTAAKADTPAPPPAAPHP